MSKSIKQETEAARFRQDIRNRLETRVRETIEIVLEEELEAALGCGLYKRSEERHGYRHGKQRRKITTRYGAKELDIPRGRIVDDDGSTREFRSEVVPRYQRRTEEVDEAILGAYLAGANSRWRGQGPPDKGLRTRASGQGPQLSYAQDKAPAFL